MKGFVSNDGVYVSDIRVVSGSYVRVVRDPSETLLVQTWIATDADTGAVIETKQPMITAPILIFRRKPTARATGNTAEKAESRARET